MASIANLRKMSYVVAKTGAGSGAANSWMAARQQAADAAAAVAAAGGNINGQMLDTQQRLESVGQRLSMPGGQRLESLAGSPSLLLAP